MNVCVSLAVTQGLLFTVLVVLGHQRKMLGTPKLQGTWARMALWRASISQKLRLVPQNTLFIEVRNGSPPVCVSRFCQELECQRYPKETLETSEVSRNDSPSSVVMTSFLILFMKLWLLIKFRSGTQTWLLRGLVPDSFGCLG